LPSIFQQANTNYSMLAKHSEVTVWATWEAESSELQLSELLLLGLARSEVWARLEVLACIPVEFETTKDAVLALTWACNK